MYGMVRRTYWEAEGMELATPEKDTLALDNHGLSIPLDKISPPIRREAFSNASRLNDCSLFVTEAPQARSQSRRISRIDISKDSQR